MRFDADAATLSQSPASKANGSKVGRQENPGGTAERTRESCKVWLSCRALVAPAEIATTLPDTPAGETRPPAEAQPPSDASRLSLSTAEALSSW
jgi:hypothetical protein